MLEFILKLFLAVTIIIGIIGYAALVVGARSDHKD